MEKLFNQLLIIGLILFIIGILSHLILNLGFVSFSDSLLYDKISISIILIGVGLIISLMVKEIILLCK